jgi:hypothetical protein
MTERKKVMLPAPRFSASINTFNACADRYVLSAYGERLTTDQLIRAATQVKGLTGVEVVGLWHVNDTNVEQIRKQIRDAGLEVTCVTPDIWASSKWGWGSFASNDPQIRRQAILEVKKSIELLELLYWLDCMSYSGWYALDIFPYRENGIRAASESIKWIQGLHGLLDKIGRAKIAQVVASGDAMSASEMLRGGLLG